MVELCCNCMNPMANPPTCEHCGFDNQGKNPDHALPRGTVVRGKYLIGRFMDYRDYCRVYMGFDFMKQEAVVIREYFSNEDPDFDFAALQDQIIQRVLTQKRLPPMPAMITPYEWLEENDRYYLIEKKPEGENLRSFMSKSGKTFEAPQLLQSLKPVMQVLEVAHSEGLLQLYITPENIVLGPEKNAVLTDFGWMFRNPCDFGSCCVGLVPGQAFLPLELWSSKGKIGPWTDVYSLCSVIWFCLTGSIPRDPGERLMDGWEPDWNSVPGLTPQQRMALRRGMAIKPENRTQSMAQLRDDLFGSPFVNVDSVSGRDYDMPAGIPAPPLMGAMVYDPDRGSDSVPGEPPKKWWQKLFHNK